MIVGEGMRQCGLADARVALEEQRPAHPQREERGSRQTGVGQVAGAVERVRDGGGVGELDGVHTYEHGPFPRSAHSVRAVMRVAAAVLAAGAGVRMGTPKAELVVDGVRLLDRAVTAAASAGCAPLYAVVRAGTEVSGAQAVVNADPDRGMCSSLALAVDAAGEVDALAVLLVDAPGITADAVRGVVAAWRPGRIAVGSYAGRRGHPTVMSPDLWRAALDLARPDEGARALLTARPELIDEVDVPGDPADLDVPDDLARWRSR